MRFVGPLGVLQVKEDRQGMALSHGESFCELLDVVHHGMTRECGFRCTHLCGAIGVDRARVQRDG